MARGKSNEAQEQLLQTVQNFEAIIEADPNDVQSLEILKEAYLNLNRDEDAVAASKKIGQAYVRLGQLSSAILEYEGILQRFPDDAACLAALGELEAKMGGSSPEGEAVAAAEAAQTLATAESFNDGNEALVKFFQEQGMIQEKDMKNLLASFHSALAETPSGRPSPSILNLMSERGLSSTEKSIAFLVDKTRMPFIPISSYEVDMNKVSLLEKDFCLQSLVLPFDQISKTTLVATVNPFDGRTKQHVEKQIHGRIQWYLAHPQDLSIQLKEVFHI